MKKQIEIPTKVIVFSKWSRNSYAVFASLKKVVKIARLTIDICISALKKLQSVIRFFKQNNIEETKSDNALDWKPLFSEWLTLLLLELNFNKLENSYNLNTNKYFLSKACVVDTNNTGFFNLKQL